jgi:hypothetical protein
VQADQGALLMRLQSTINDLLSVHTRSAVIVERIVDVQLAAQDQAVRVADSLKRADEQIADLSQRVNALIYFSGRDTQQDPPIQ